MPRRVAYFVDCDWMLMLDARGRLCNGTVWRYRRKAKSFGVTFVTSARLCASHHSRLSFWRNAERTPVE